MVVNWWSTGGHVVVKMATDKPLPIPEFWAEEYPTVVVLWRAVQKQQVLADIWCQWAMVQRLHTWTDVIEITVFSFFQDLQVLLSGMIASMHGALPLSLSLWTTLNRVFGCTVCWEGSPLGPHANASVMPTEDLKPFMVPTPAEPQTYCVYPRLTQVRQGSFPALCFMYADICRRLRATCIEHSSFQGDGGAGAAGTNSCWARLPTLCTLYTRKTLYALYILDTFHTLYTLDTLDTLDTPSTASTPSTPSGPGQPGPGAPSPHHGRDPTGGACPSGSSSTAGGRGCPGVPAVRVRGVLLAADGVMEVKPEGDTLGWGALVADIAGVLATVASGIQTRAASPWAAEWAGKLEAWHLAETLGVAPAAVQYVGADCTSATLGSDGGIPSQSPWVDRVRVAFAEALGRSRPDLYVPAQHNTQWSGLLSNL